MRCFNPRTRKGATVFRQRLTGWIEFQSTHPQGCDMKVATYDGAMEEFQSTHPQGCDSSPPMGGQPRPMFQSTHPQGCDSHRRAMGGPPMVSIHAPARVRPACRGTSLASWRFNPRTRKGATTGHR